MSFLSRDCVCTSAGQVSKVPGSVFLVMWGTTNIDEAQRSQRLHWSFSLSQCVWTVLLAILWFLKWIFFCFHEDFSSSVCPALFSELGFRVYHRWGVGKWNSKTEIEEAKRGKFMCMCVDVSILNVYQNWKLYCVCVCYFVSQVLWISTTILGDTGYAFIFNFKMKLKVAF